MKISGLQKAVEIYSDRVNRISIKPEIKGDTHFNHIASNLLNRPKMYTKCLKDGLYTWDEIKRSIAQDMKALKTYLRLIEEFPDFKNAEFYSEQGYFLGIRDWGSDLGSGARFYVFEAKKILSH